MAPEPTPILVPLPPPGGPAPPPDKVRIRFRKDGALRLLSHHDLMRCFERMLRRAALPVRQTKGFHPKPRLVFALSLPLGVIGCEEVVELELDETLPPEEVRERLARQAPPGLTILGLRRIDFKASAQIQSLTYRIALPAERVGDAARRATEVLAADECWAERTRPTLRRVDLRAWIMSLRVNETTTVSRDAERSAAASAPLRVAANPPAHLEMELRLTPAGTARPEEVLAVLGLSDLLDAGAVLERSRLALVDETPPPLAEGNA
jgi:radical SAM-linked protein